MAFSKSSLYECLFIDINFLGHLCLLGVICLFINTAKQNPKKKNLSDASKPHLDAMLDPFDAQEV